jgi:GntR family transcriptional regulator/MocR family aminotransferase
VRVDTEGLDVGALPDDVRLVYVTPSHQFPLGTPMSHARRLALLQWAERRNAVIVEDDYDSEFRFGGRPLETLQASDRSGRVLYVGSFSKSLLPALRLGFVIAPPSLRDALRQASYVTGWHPPFPAQSVLASFIAAGLLSRQVARARRVYAQRHERILSTLVRDFAQWLMPVRSVAGMHLSAILRSRSVRLEGELADRAAAEDVGFDRLSRYYAGSPRRSGLVLGYGAIATENIEEGLRRLRKCCIATYGKAR